jgi:2-dehydro-3-deoxyglucarate aldolase
LYVRVSTRSISKYKWFLDIGYDGIILSDVRKPEDVDSLIKAVYFPPYGNRGVGYCYKNGFGKYMNNYLNDNSSPFLGIQIESVDGIHNLENILELYSDKISACFLGPYDLSCDLGITGDFTNNLFQLHKDKYFAILQRYQYVGKGTHVVSNDFSEVLESSVKGYNYIAFSTDGLLLQNSLNQIDIL